MVRNGLVAQVDKVGALEAELADLQVAVGRRLRVTREDAELSLRDVAQKVRLSTATLSNIERGASWKTRTVRRVAVFYESLSAA
jgi:ribosome-binding protein aMBF1 (putative translation factor)